MDTKCKDLFKHVAGSSMGHLQHHLAAQVLEADGGNEAFPPLLATVNKHLVASRQKNKPWEHVNAAMTFN